MTPSNGIIGIMDLGSDSSSSVPSTVVADDKEVEDDDVCRGCAEVERVRVVERVREVELGEVVEEVVEEVVREVEVEEKEAEVSGAQEKEGKIFCLSKIKSNSSFDISEI